MIWIERNVGVAGTQFGTEFRPKLSNPGQGSKFVERSGNVLPPAACPDESNFGNHSSVIFSRYSRTPFVAFRVSNTCLAWATTQL